MNKILYILPAGRLGLCSTFPDYNANSARSLLDGHMAAPGQPFSENHYSLDENGAERLGTPYLVFLSPDEPLQGIGCVSIGKIDIFGPIFVCSSKYRGWSREQIPLAVQVIQNIILTSEGGDYNMKAKSLDEMLKEYGSKS